MLSERIYQFRRNSGLSQEQLAEKIGEMCIRDRAMAAIWPFQKSISAAIRESGIGLGKGVS